MGAGGGIATTQIPVTPEDNSLVCRLNTHAHPDQMHIAAGVCVFMCVNITECLSNVRLREDELECVFR